MNIETSNINQSKEIKKNIVPNTSNQEPSSVKFADELKNNNQEQITEENVDLENSLPINTEKNINTENIHTTKTEDNIEQKKQFDNNVLNTINIVSTNTNLQNNIKINNNSNYNTINATNNTINVTNNTINATNNTINATNNINLDNFKKNNNDLDLHDKKTKDENPVNNTNTESNNTLDFAYKNLNEVFNEFNQSDDKSNKNVQKTEILTDNNNVINNDFNIQDKKDIQPQVNINLGFSGDGQPFSSFMNDEEKKNKPSAILKTTIEEIAEEKAILSTMEENIAIANKNQILKESKVIIDENEIKKVDASTGVKIETIVKLDTIVLNETDAELLINLVQNGEVNLNLADTKVVEKFTQISKTLANLLVNSMEKNQPVRIEFDNNISVIIKISREGKITADFLPSSQVAEAYLRENLPLLRQRFDDNNIEYDSLNQRERRDNNKENNKKKERNNE